MTVRELRIGNWIRTVNKKWEVCITAFNTDQHDEKFWEGIPLSEEWLKRCEFNFKKLGFDDLSVAHNITSNTFYFHIGNYAKKIIYVHHLQNLYFELVGEELKFKQEEQ